MTQPTNPTPIRDLSIREKFHLSTLGLMSSPKEVVSYLLKSKDVQGLAISRAYYSPHVQEIYHVLSNLSKSDLHIEMASYQLLNSPKGQVTSTALLDHFLEDIPADKKKQILKDAVAEATSFHDVTTIDVFPLDVRTNRYTVQDVTGKLLVLARHGADMNPAILDASTPALVIRNAMVAAAVGQPLSKEAAQYTTTVINSLTKGYSNMTQAENALLPSLIEAGAAKDIAARWQYIPPMSMQAPSPRP